MYLGSQAKLLNKICVFFCVYPFFIRFDFMGGFWSSIKEPPEKPLSKEEIGRECFLLS
jgi:hypothetical protein